MKYLTLVALLFIGCRENRDGKVHITYWESGRARKRRRCSKSSINSIRSQEKIVVEYLAMSSVDRKTMVATAGGDPPDVAGLCQQRLLLRRPRRTHALDDSSNGTGRPPSNARPVRLCVRRHVFISRQDLGRNQHPVGDRAALEQTAILEPVSTPTGRRARSRSWTNSPASSLSGMRRARFTQLGFLRRSRAGFAGRSEMVWALSTGWTRDHARGHPDVVAMGRKLLRARYGIEQIKAFSSGFGTSPSPDNPFMSGKIAMVLQGVWMNNVHQVNFSPVCNTA